MFSVYSRKDRDVHKKHKPLRTINVTNEFFNLYLSCKKHSFNFNQFVGIFNILNITKVILKNQHFYDGDMIMTVTGPSNY